MLFNFNLINMVDIGICDLVQIIIHNLVSRGLLFRLTSFLDFFPLLLANIYTRLSMDRRHMNSICRT